MANHLRACVLFLCCSYLGKTRTDLKVFFPESEQYKNAEKEVLGLQRCKMPDKWVACVNIFVVLHLSFQQTFWYFRSIQYWWVPYNCMMQYPSWDRLLAGSPCGYWNHPLKGGHTGQKCNSSTMAQQRVLKAETIATGNCPQTSSASFPKCLLLDEFLVKYWTSIERPLLVFQLHDSRLKTPTPWRYHLFLTLFGSVK